MNDASASQQIDAIVRKTIGWRGERLGQLRAVIRSADPGLIEEVKWKKPSRPEAVLQRPLRSNHSPTCDEPEKAKQDDCPDEGDDDQGQGAGYGDPDKPREPAAQERPQDPDDDVPDEPEPVPGHDVPGQEAGDCSDDDEDDQVHFGRNLLLAARPSSDRSGR